MKIAPSVWFSAAGVFAFGAVGFWLAGLNSPTRVVLCFVCSVLGALTLYASLREYYIRVGETAPRGGVGSAGEATSAVPKVTATRGSVVRAAEAEENAKPNIVPVMAHVVRVYVDHSTHEIRAGEGSRFDTPYTALVVPFRNDPTTRTRVADAYEVKARIAIGNEVYPVTGYWIQSDRDHISVPVGGHARELLIALRDRQGLVHLVDDRRDENNPRPAEILMFWTPTMPGDGFPVRIQLVMEGMIICEATYDLNPRTFGLVRRSS